MKMQKLILLTLLVISPLLLTGCVVTTEDGEHTGYISAVEKNGIIWKTNRAYIKTELESSQEEAYCVESDEIYEQLKQKSSNKEQVTLIFKDELIVAPWRCSEGEIGIVTGIK